MATVFRPVHAVRVIIIVYYYVDYRAQVPYVYAEVIHHPTVWYFNSSVTKVRSRTNRECGASSAYSPIAITNVGEAAVNRGECVQRSLRRRDRIGIVVISVGTRAM